MHRAALRDYSRSLTTYHRLTWYMHLPDTRKYMFYDGLSRLLAADYSVGADYTYGYDVAGNLVNNNGVTRTYNAANQMTNDGTNTLTYDNNGNLTNDGVNAYTWDRANRMLTAPGSTSYKYDGVSNRIAQTVSGVVTAYLNDVQPGLTQLLAETASGNTTRYVQGVRGIHATESHAGVWSYAVQDGLRSVRGWADSDGDLNNPVSYSPYGVPSTSVTGFAYTGEVRDGSGLQYHRARYYSPSSAIWTAQDFLETLNRYQYVYGNPVNLFDLNGLEPPAFSEDDPYGGVLGESSPAGQQDAGGAFGIPYGTNLIPSIMQPFGFGVPTGTSIGLPIGGIVGAIFTLPAAIWLAVTQPTTQEQPVQPIAPDGTRPNDDNNKRCDCNVMRALAGGYQPFGVTNGMSPQEELLCSMRCTFGHHVANSYENQLIPLGVDMVFIPMPSLFSGAFGLLGETLGYGNHVVTNPAGTIGLGQPYLGVFTRADRMASFVEEVRHAGQFHSLRSFYPVYGRYVQKRCEEFGFIEGEIDAKNHKRSWVFLSIHSGRLKRPDFMNTWVLNNTASAEALRQYRTTRPRDTLFPLGSCPGSNDSGALPKESVLACVNPYLLSHINM